MRACCAPDSDRASSRVEQLSGGARPSTLVELPGGSFVMGDESAWAYPGDGEGPAHDVLVGAFAIDRYAVTNEAFCHHSYCRRYRVSARQGNEPASSTGNLGFRVAADLVAPVLMP